MTPTASRAPRTLHQAAAIPVAPEPHAPVAPPATWQRWWLEGGTLTWAWIPSPAFEKGLIVVGLSIVAMAVVYRVTVVLTDLMTDLEEEQDS